MVDSIAPILPQGAGYGVVVGIGMFFSAFMLGLTAVQGRYTAFKPSSSEEFTSASRSVKPGLVASAVVSAWTWAATLLQSSAVAYKYGISGPWWYGAGATVQVLLFAQIAAKLKMNAPYAHTFLEIIGRRWGTAAHLVFLFFGLATNIIVSSMLILGGSATVTNLTGMSTIAACFLIPLTVALYVAVGGMRSTLLCDYTHTSVLFVIILLFVFTVYASSPKIGSFAHMHALLDAASAAAPVAGNEQGSYLTLRSTNGLVFGVINTVGNFATVFQDQAYWQRAVASRPASCVKAYLLGGLAWFAIPFTFASTLGLAAVALRSTAPGDGGVSLSPEEVSKGLAASAAAAALLGKAGAACLLVVLFLAVTSATSAELIAVSSILTYDVYKRYVNPAASEAQILRVSHAMVAFFALVMALCGLIFYYIGVSMGWLYTFMGVILGSAVVPIALAVTSARANRVACVSGAVLGFVAGIGAWLGTTSARHQGVINVTTSGGDYEMLAGNLASIGVGAVVAYGGSLLWSEQYDFADTRALNAPPGSRFYAPTAAGLSVDEREHDGEEKKSAEAAADVRSVAPSSHDAAALTALRKEEDEELEPVGLARAFRFAAWSSVVLTAVLLLLIPLPLFFARTVFGVRGFAAWAGIGIAWTFCSAGAVVLYPLWESRRALREISGGIVKDIFAPGTGKYVARPIDGDA